MPLSSRRRVTATQPPRDRDAAATRRPQVYAKHLELIDADKEVVEVQSRLAAEERTLEVKPPRGRLV